MNDNKPSLEERAKRGLLVVVAAIWAVLGTTLWAFSFLTISLVWILGPVAYLIHLNIHNQMIKRAVKEEMANVVDGVAATADGLYGAILFEDATHLEGSLN